jgi:hypothetical protein
VLRSNFFSARNWGANTVYNAIRGNGTEAAETNVSTGNELAQYRQFGFFSGAIREAARMTSVVDGAPSGTTVPGRWDFLTQGASGSIANRLSIRATGRIQQHESTLDGWMVARGADTTTDIPTLGIDHRHATRAIISISATTGATSDTPIWTDTSAGSLAQKIKVTINGNTRWIYAYSN